MLHRLFSSGVDFPAPLPGSGWPSAAATTSGLRSPSTAARALHDGSAAVRGYEDFKNSYLDTRSACISDGFSFTPMVAEAVGGGWGPSAKKVFLELAKTKSLISGESKNKILSQFYQTTGTIIHRENARAILRRCTAVFPEARQILATAALLQSAAAEDTH